MPLLFFSLLCGAGLWGAAAWNSVGTQQQIYTFQEFYSDAQYGPDFGYYSTGRILHNDGPADNGLKEAAGSQEWFNSYTTMPMSISPEFAHALCDRLVIMWHSMGRPTPIVVTEFGGGTGMLARDILRRSQDRHSDFYKALALYVIGERSRALRDAQKHTAAEFVAAGKLQVVQADARQAALLRPTLEEALGVGKATVGFVLSNELLDELDPVRMRLMWYAGKTPTVAQCADCASYWEAHVVHSVDSTALQALLEGSGGAGGGGRGEYTAGAARAAMDEWVWEGRTLHCGLLETPALRRAVLAVAEELPAVERGLCAPMLVCCLPFLLAVNQALQFDFEALSPGHIFRRRRPDGSRELVALYRHHLQLTNNTVPLSKERYRQLRRLASARGADFERALLVGGASSALPGRLRSEEVFLALHPARCAELQGWLNRSAQRLAVTSRMRNSVAWLYDGDTVGKTSMHLKVVLRPGEASFVEQASLLLDEGFLVNMDYGADADALAWQGLVRPNYEGIQIVDARAELASECTTVSFLECPGLQDLTTSVDFTEVAEAGRQLGGWKVLAYGPIFFLETAFIDSSIQLAPTGDPQRLGHLVERAHGMRTAGLQAWYRKLEQDPWASFKVLVQHRGQRGASWSLGALGNAWAPLTANPRLFHPPSPCWRQDLTKPPLASLIASLAADNLPVGVATTVENPKLHAALLEQFAVVLVQTGPTLAQVLDREHVKQQEAYANVHLAALLVDYWRLLQEVDDEDGGVDDIAGQLEEIRTFATSRRLPEIYEEAAFERVFADIGAFVRNDSAAFPPTPRSAYACLAELALHGGALTATATGAPPLDAGAGSRHGDAARLGEAMTLTI
mmetsp:Transcript_86995/g.243909  ORF Transcript_86995/g.243909 Transcript_86995/m.243909 type:complete len:854 (-) Transcript_86995:148-2709(-)